MNRNDYARNPKFLLVAIVQKQYFATNFKLTRSNTVLRIELFNHFVLILLTCDVHLCVLMVIRA